MGFCRGHPPGYTLVGGWVSVDTEAAAASGDDAAEDIHSIGHVAPHGRVFLTGCGRRSAWEQLIPAIGLAKVAEMFVSYKETIDSKSFLQNPITILILQNLSWPLGRNLPKFLFPASSPPLRP